MITVLVVDDEAMFRNSLAKLLLKRGFHALEADGAGTALALLRDSNHNVDLILADLVMPGTNGLELAQRIRELKPHVKIVFMSGYPPNGFDMTDILPHFLQKPFRADALIAKIMAELEMGV